MDEKRLIEIASEFIRNDGPLSRMAYLSSLRENEISLLCEYMKNYKCAELNFYDMVVNFFQEYLASRNITLADVMGEEIDEVKAVTDSISYLDNMLASGEVSGVIGNKAKR